MAKFYNADASLIEKAVENALISKSVWENMSYDSRSRVLLKVIFFNLVFEGVGIKYHFFSHPLSPYKHGPLKFYCESIVFLAACSLFKFLSKVVQGCPICANQLFGLIQRNDNSVLQKNMILKMNKNIFSTFRRPP